MAIVTMEDENIRMICPIAGVTQSPGLTYYPVQQKRSLRVLGGYL